MILPSPTNFFDLYRVGLKSTADMMKISLESAERFQQQQLAALHGTLEQQARSADELSGAKSLEELLAVQQKMTRAWYERAAGYWTDFYQAAAQQSRSVASGAFQASMPRSSSQPSSHPSYSHEGKQETKHERKAA